MTPDDRSLNDDDTPIAHDDAAEGRFQAAAAEHQKPKADGRPILHHDSPTDAQLADDEPPPWVKAGKDAPPGWRRNAKGDFEEDA